MRSTQGEEPRKELMSLVKLQRVSQIVSLREAGTHRNTSTMARFSLLAKRA